MKPKKLQFFGVSQCINPSNKAPADGEITPKFLKEVVDENHSLRFLTSQ